MKKILKFLLKVCILIAVIYGIIYCIKNKNIKDIFKMLENEKINIEEYYIYGTHFNINGKLSIIDTSEIKDVKISFLQNNKKETEYKCIYKVDDKNIEISTSEFINHGIYLEDINYGQYYIFIKIYYNNDTIKYYTFNENNMLYKDLEYYTITKNGMNNKIDISFKNKKIQNKEIPYINVLCKKTKLPEEVYDISIDPGHGGSDPGAINEKYKEADIVMEYGILIKEKLEELGLKVILTRDGTEDDTYSLYSTYNHNGRVNVVGRARVKYNLSIHINSLDVNTVSGTEIYAPPNVELEIAQAFADNIVNIAKTTYSTRTINKTSNGVYVRTFTKDEIIESNNNAEKEGYLPYNITTETPYLYMIREVGGIVTKAYIDGRNKAYGINEYYNSNIGVESYLIELGYINNQKDLNNILNNKELYIKAIEKTVEEHICNN